MCDGRRWQCAVIISIDCGPCVCLCVSVRMCVCVLCSLCLNQAVAMRVMRIDRLDVRLRQQPIAAKWAFVRISCEIRSASGPQQGAQGRSMHHMVYNLAIERRCPDRRTARKVDEDGTHPNHPASRTHFVQAIMVFMVCGWICVCVCAKRRGGSEEGQHVITKF